MKRTLRVSLFVGVVACAVAASALMVRAGGAAGVGIDNAGRQARAGARAGTSPTPQASAPPQRDERLWQRAMAIHRRAIIVDGHNDIPTIMVDENYDLGTPSAGKYHTDLQRLKQSGMTGEFFSIYVDRQYATPEWVNKNYITEGGSSRRALDLIDMT
ncbi:MAG: dipeptidase, partial [Acidobacteriota bacterium]|nr:dipeptidase [Acidobacteriota bacterium]